MPLKVTLSVAPDFSPNGGLLWGRVSGPDNFTLSPSQPSVTVDFAIGKSDIH